MDRPVVGRTIRSAVVLLLAAMAAIWPCRADGQTAPYAPPVRNRLAPPEPMSSPATRRDARLSGISATDAEHVWAVGDRGAIWHTEDGGRQWRPQESGVGCALRSVFFLDRGHGWAVGGFSHPYAHGSTGVVLLTRDGGLTWQAAPQQVLPLLRRVRMIDARRGWAAGVPSALYPSGVFTTGDGGLSWTPLPGLAPHGGWTAADFLDISRGVVAGRQGAAAAAERGSLYGLRLTELGLRTVGALRLAPPASGYLLGDGGALMLSADRGATWQVAPPAALPAHFEQFDLTATAVVGSNVWVAGSPGSVVFHSPDAGRSWTALPTGSPLPIRALEFIDDRRGWAAGSLGTILATDDGGRTWTAQRSGGSRAAFMGIFAEPEDLPAELFARLSGNEGHLGVVEAVGRRDVEIEPTADTAAADRLHEAVVLLGGCEGRLAWAFPLRQRGLALGQRQIVELWDRLHDDRSLERLEAELTRQIRLWRPDVVVTHHPRPRDDDAESQLVAQVVLRAVAGAADPARFPEQLSALRLAPWEVKKVYGALEPGESGSAEVVTAQLATRLGLSLAELGAPARGLVADDFQPAPMTLGFDLLQSRVAQHGAGRDFFTGLATASGSPSRRELLDPPSEGLDMLRRAALRRRNVQAILDHMERNEQGGSALLAQAGELTWGLDADCATSVLHQLGRRYQQAGEWPIAAEVYRLLADRHGDHPLARPALAWLVRYYASAEAAHRMRGREAMDIRPAERAVELGDRIAAGWPDLAAEPALRFSLAAAQRNLGQAQQAERSYTALSRSPSRGAWRSCAAGELWLLAQRFEQPPKPIARCRRTAERPRLDGRLDDPVWRQAATLPLRGALGEDADWPAVVMLAYDAEHLYVAARCRRAPGVAYEPASGPRPRNPDLSKHDRVELLIDVDRDYATYYRLIVDHRGFAAEDCWGDATWNPAWYVAAGADEEHWTFEVAVPMAELVAQPPEARSVWAIGVQRVVPGAGFQSWTQPAAVVARAEGFGYLAFE